MPGATPSPNLWNHPRLYETLNRAADPEGLLAAALDDLLGSRVRAACDIGCGTGFHLALLAARADTVVGVEPHQGLAEMARRRVERARLGERVAVRPGVAQHLPLPDASMDLVFSHWAYFFGPGCEPGLAEASRVLRPGGVQVVVDVDTAATHGYPRWLSGRRDVRDPGPFFAEHGFSARSLPVVWDFADRQDLAAVLGIEFPAAVAARALAETVGSTIAVPTVLRWRRVSGPPATSPAGRTR